MAKRIILIIILASILILPVHAEIVKVDSSLKSIQGIKINVDSIFAPEGATISYGKTYELEIGDTKKVSGIETEVKSISADCEVKIEVGEETCYISSSVQQCDAIFAAATNCNGNVTDLFLGFQEYLSKGEYIEYDDKKITLIKVSSSGYAMISVGEEVASSTTNGTTSSQVATCIDSDGTDFYKNGTVNSSINGIKVDTCQQKGGKGVLVKDVDSCSGSNCYVAEWICDDAKKAVKADEFQCNSCTAGACISSAGDSGTEETSSEPSLWEQLMNWWRSLFQ